MCGRAGVPERGRERERERAGPPWGKGRGDNTRSGIIEGCETGKGLSSTVSFGDSGPSRVTIALLRPPPSLLALVLVLAAAIDQIAETGLQPLYDIIEQLRTVSNDLVQGAPWPVVVVVVHATVVARVVWGI